MVGTSVFAHEWRMVQAGLVVRMEGGGVRSCCGGTLRSRIQVLRDAVAPAMVRLHDHQTVRAEDFRGDLHDVCMDYPVWYVPDGGVGG